MKEFLHLTQLRDRSSRWLAWTAVLAVSLGGVWLCQHRGAGRIEPEARSTPNGRWQVAAASMAGPPAAPLFPPATSALAAVGHQVQPYQTLRQLDLSGPPSPLSASLTTGVSAKPNVHGGGLRFEPNVGQTDRRVQYLVRGRAGAVFLCGRETVLAPGNRSEGRSAVLISSLIGSGPIQLQGEAPTGEQVAYLTGNRPEQWKTGVETVSRVRAGNVYPGIDAVWYGREGELEYDLELAPGAAPERIGLRFTGAESVRLNREGALVFRLGAGEVRQSRPVAWQERNGVREPVAVRYELTGPETVAFRLGAYDRSRQLVIDPVISYSSFAGGLGADRGYAVAVDGAGATYLTGMTRSADFPGATGTAGGSLDAFVCKLNPDGSGPVWSLYLGGSGADQGAAIAVDGGGVVVAGTSDSPNFPLVTPLQGTPGGGLDAFVVKVKPDGSGLLWGTLLGGRQAEQANGVALAPNG
ncbi:MAG: hypothetical protein K1Y36_29945, partial [Blastocatellia bacterium]|nr:hypothetical protein [Blastocatellia bacterium]